MDDSKDSDFDWVTATIRLREATATLREKLAALEKMRSDFDPSEYQIVTDAAMSFCTTLDQLMALHAAARSATTVSRAQN